jgi:hypothetical protein
MFILETRNLRRNQKKRRLGACSGGNVTFKTGRSLAFTSDCTAARSQCREGTDPWLSPTVKRTKRRTGKDDPTDVHSISASGSSSAT